MAEPHQYAGAVHAREDDDTGSGEEDRRVRPRHDESDEPNAVAAAATTDSPQPASAATAPTSAALYDDALASIFRFLSLCELAAALRVSRAWCSFVRERMASAGLDLSLYHVPVTPRCSALTTVARSALVRHIRWLNCDRVRTEAGFSPFMLPVWRGLRSLIVDLPAPSSKNGWQTVTFPPLLEEMQIHLGDKSQNVLEAVSRLERLHTLQLSAHAGVKAMESVGCLQRAAGLRSLRADVCLRLSRGPRPMLIDAGHLVPNDDAPGL